MPFFDMPLEQLETYTPQRSEPADFDAFWNETLQATREHDLDAQFVPYDAGLALVDVYDVTFSGYGGQPIKGWYIRPTNNQVQLPCIVEFIGYGGGRGFPFRNLAWANAGYAYFLMDTRGQGGAWSHGDTPDIPEGGNPAHPGFMTQGILNPTTYYYRRVFTDAVRAIEAVLTRGDVDASRIAATGASQGGGITIAVSALMPDVALCMPDVAFLCHYRQAVGKTDKHPYQEIVRYLSVQRDKEEQVFETLDYFDGVNFAARIQSQSYFSAALMDTVCPPSTIFAAYNQINAPKHIEIYPYNGHEGGGEFHTLKQLQFVNGLWR